MRDEGNVRFGVVSGRPAPLLTEGSGQESRPVAVPRCLSPTRERPTGLSPARGRQQANPPCQKGFGSLARADPRSGLSD
jgi:hypothetical protein